MTYGGNGEISNGLINMKLTDKEVEAVVEWMNTWDQLRGTSIPMRFKEEFSRQKTEAEKIMDNCMYHKEFECDCFMSCYYANKNS